MKKRLKFLFLIPIFLISALLCVIIPKNVDTSNTNQNGDFNTFSNAFINLLNNNSFDEYKEMSFNLNDDVYKNNNTYMISSDTFANITGSYVSISSSNEVQITSNETTITLSNEKNIIKSGDEDIDVMPENVAIENCKATFPIESVADALGFDLKFDDDTLFLSRPYQTKRLIIKSSTSLDKQGAIQYAEGYNGLHIFQYTTEEETINAYNYYNNLDYVEYVEVDSIITSTSIEEDTIVSSVQDSFSYTSWGADSIGAKDYSNYLINNIGSNNLPELVVAVLDSGLDSDHAWFQNRISNGGTNYSSSTSSTSYAWEDVYGHGTHVSGIIADLTLSNVKILPIKVMNDNGYGYQSSILLGINYVINKKQDGMNICAMNLSLGSYNTVGSEEQNAYKTALQNAYSNNILAIVAAGNRGTYVADHTPSNVACAITVSAVGKSGDLYYCPSWSNYGSYIDISAPGNQIVSACVGGGVTTMSGTSMSTPHVTGAIALLYSDSTKNYTKTDIENILDNTAIDLGDSGWDQYYGEGMVNIQYAYASVIDKVIFSNNETDCLSSFDLTLSTTESNTTIYYTLDGTNPSLTNGTKYTSPISITKTQRIKVIAYVFDGSNNVKSFSKVSDITYCFYGEDIENAFTVDASGTLTKYNGVLTEVTVPKQVNGIVVTTIGTNSFSSSSVEVVTLPSTVTLIYDRAFMNCSTIQKVYGPAVTRIDNQAFYNCSSFMYVTDEYFPKLLSFGSYTFYNCYSLRPISLSKLENVSYYTFCMSNSTEDPTFLTSITLPNAKSIGEYAFSGCKCLTEINIPSVETIGAYAFKECDLVDVSLPSAKYIGERSFYANSNLTTVDMPEALIIGKNSFFESSNLTTANMPKVLTIGVQSFYSCPNLTSVNIPKVKLICSHAFYKCSSLTTLNTPELEEVHALAFSHCTSLTNINVPKLKYISYSTFREIKGLTEINLPSVISIGYHAFSITSSNLTKITLSNCIEFINDSFDYNKNCVFYVYENTVGYEYASTNGFTIVNLSSDNLFNYTIVNNEVHITGYKGELQKELILPSYIENLPVTTICENAFKNYLNIYSLSITNLTTIEDYAFAGCSNLKSVVLDNIITIGESAFENCINLSELDIFNVENLDNRAFYGCSKVLEVKFSTKISFIGEKALGFNVDDKLIPTFVIYGYDTTVAKEYANNNSITFMTIVNNFAVNYQTYNNNGTTEIYIYSIETSTTGNIILPSSHNGMTVSKIGDNAFNGCCFITSIVMPENIKIIGDNAFYNCNSLERINLEYVTSLGTNSFANCESLKYINMPLVEEIPSTAFCNCDSLIEANIPKVKIIGDNAFDSCYSLKRVISPSLENIGNMAFYYSCSLEKIDTLNVKVIGTTQTGLSFSYGSCLTSLYLPKIEKLGNSLFAASEKMKKILIGKNFSTYYNIPISSSITIYGYSNTLAQTYADKNGNTFIPIDGLGITTDLPNEKEVNQNDKASLSIVYSGFEQTYQWYETERDTSNAVAIEGATSDTLKLDTTTLGTKKYYVIITDLEDFTITSNICEVTVTTAKPKFTITATCGENGTISPSGITTVNYGDEQAFTFSPNTGYYVASVVVDGSELINDDLANAITNGCLFSNITKDHTISVSFAIQTFSITVTQTANGTTSPESIDSVTYGSTKTFTFTPNTGYHIASISIDGTTLTDSQIQDAISNGYTFQNISANHTITATFAISTYTVKLTKNNGGTVSPNTDVTVNYGESLTFTFTADTGYYVASVVVDESTLTDNDLANAIANGYSFSNITRNHTLSVSFAIQTFTVNVNCGENGTISPSGITTVNYGDEQTFTFSPNTGYYVASVVVDESTLTDSDLANAIANGYSFSNITRNHTLSVYFAIQTFTVNVNCGDNGTVSPSGKLTANYGESLTFTITPDENYGISYIDLNGNKIPNNSTITINNITKNQTLKVVFVKVFLITTSCGENGTISTSTTVALGEEKTFNFYPNTGYKIKDVKIDNESIGPVQNYTFTNIDKNHTIYVEYEIQTFNISYSVEGQGTIKATKELENVPYGENRVFTFSADDGWELAKVYVNGRSVNISNYTFIVANIKEDSVIKAIFKEKSTSLSASTIAIIVGVVIFAILFIVLILKSVIKRKWRY